LEAHFQPELTRIAVTATGMADIGTSTRTDIGTRTRTGIGTDTEDTGDIATTGAHLSKSDLLRSNGTDGLVVLLLIV